MFKRIYNNREDNVSIDKIRKEYEAIRIQMDTLLEEYQIELRRYERREKETVSDLRKTLSKISSSSLIQTPNANRPSKGKRRKASEE